MRHPLILALVLFGTWTLLTYLLEGFPRTLLRPEAIALRLTYAAIANLGVGIVGAAWLLRYLSRAGAVTLRAAGFRHATHSLAAGAAGAGLGLAFYLARQPPSRDVVIIANAFSQILVVSTAEVLVCWAAVGTTLEAALRKRAIPLPTLWAAVGASVLFGAYHFAHSPPFNSVRLVALLAAIGLLTSAFFFMSRDVYGTIVLHNFFGLFGVLDALRRTRRLESYAEWAPPLLATAAVTVLLLIGLHAAWLRGEGSRGIDRPAKA